MIAFKVLQKAYQECFFGFHKISVSGKSMKFIRLINRLLLSFSSHWALSFINLADSPHPYIVSFLSKKEIFKVLHFGPHIKG